ncbi:hypothetical protein AVEN_63411-1 [Araneus ventricosus]|uniref:Uncharacterized protein n=1 Tax=Araneus ventricosus TaxID=182803 RepID=A0A4Y2K8V4_ARAVE|nr:hypothetical protein AVEN_63411-1 [Araneus ventricosus]
MVVVFPFILFGHKSEIGSFEADDRSSVWATGALRRRNVPGSQTGDPGENALTSLADSAINLIKVVIPLILMFWIPEQIPLEMENLKKIIRCKYEMRTSYGIVSENSTIEKLLLEEKIFVVFGCNLIFFRRRNILSVLGTALTYGLLLIGLEVRK